MEVVTATHTWTCTHRGSTGNVSGGDPCREMQGKTGNVDTWWWGQCLYAKKIISTGYILCFSLHSLCSLNGSSPLSCTYIPCMSSIPAIPYTKGTDPTTMYLHYLCSLFECNSMYNHHHVPTFPEFSCVVGSLCRFPSLPCTYISCVFLNAFQFPAWFRTWFPAFIVCPSTHLVYFLHNLIFF